MIRFACSSCKFVMQTEPQYAGQKVACPQCQTLLVVPVPAAMPVEAPPSPPKLSFPEPGPSPMRRFRSRLDVAREMAEWPDDTPDLGEPHFVLRAGFFTLLKRWFATVGGVIIFLAVFSLCCTCWTRPMFGHGPLALLLSLLIPSTVPLGLGAFLLIAFCVAPRTTLWLCPDGLVWKHRSRFGWSRWSELPGFRRKLLRVRRIWRTRWGATVAVRTERFQSMEITGPNGERLYFDTRGSGQSVPAFADVVEDEAGRVLRPLLARELESGKEIDFSPVHVSRNTLRVGVSEVPLANVDDFWLANGKLMISLRPRKFWREVPCGNVSFLQLCLEFLHALVQAGKPAAQAPANPFKFN
jgi:hypothetical protein